ncbi:MAG: hypothetical protein QOD42_1984 [Sphingomonadales bacterium]|jgi:hypothetical protein|nr:hypothetical protein [Sphingomonadales bacterium]
MQNLFAALAAAALALQAQGPAAPDLPPIAERSGTDWRASDADRQAVVDSTLAYLQAKDGGRYDAAWAFLTPGNRQRFPLAAWSEEARAFNASAGAVAERRVTRLTWYDNPPAAGEPGIYAAVDFTSDFANLHFLCGFLIWRRQEDGGWRLAREEQNMVSRAEAPELTAEQRANARRAMHCQD